MINEQQKEAIAVLNRLHGQGPNAGYLLTDEEYFMLMEYVLQETNCATDEHATHKGDEADDSVIIEDLHNRVIKQSDEIERLRNEKNLLVEKISRNYLGDLLRAVNLMQQGLQDKKHKIELIDSGLKQIQDALQKMKNNNY